MLQFPTYEVVSDGKVNILVHYKEVKMKTGNFYAKLIFDQNRFLTFYVFSLAHRFEKRNGSRVTEKKDSERSEEFIDFTMMCVITSRNNAPISNFGGGFRCKSEYPWYIIEFKIFKKIEKNKKKMTEKREFLRKTSFRQNRFFYMVVIKKLITVNTLNFHPNLRFDNLIQVIHTTPNVQHSDTPYPFNLKFLYWLPFKNQNLTPRPVRDILCFSFKIIQSTCAHSGELCIEKPYLGLPVIGPIFHYP
ncbi:Uncharacterized protein FWK35_00014564 [Aphis craccivora]|uniref:Uncharacterized protein n=1 Tax=Aphis craccivora TaxID=307492 RepID=A0A6G0Y506_APHCR|nr:Uncharacterized protein FWK35_00014564 [Aphis craccivora]